MALLALVDGVLARLGCVCEVLLSKFGLEKSQAVKRDVPPPHLFSTG